MDQIKTIHLRTGTVVAAACILLACAAGIPAQESGGAQSTGAVQNSNAASTSPDEEALTRKIEAAVAKRIRPLVREISELKEEVRFHDILGGIGYILGLAGVAFYFLGVRRRGQARIKKETTE